ncbi:hypothetical protein D9619_004708 [Psilocybe cf. subviscida]|uniref:UDENN domain-containing protein n=1 Tax=Psilocybe cf. subviscida TaxID=2480587 RepID=A0A8H5BPJ6_9AGAR|nr:hypothetical protein D9619_004708 [Psilocybe cf. subviscida]
MVSRSSSIEVQEEDIGNLSPYSLHNSPSSTTVGSSNGDPAADEGITEHPYSAPGSEETPTQTTFSTQSLLPSLTRKGDKMFPVSRARTLPVDSSSPSNSEISKFSEIAKLDVDVSQVAKMRRWILGVAIVDFDLDSGPVVEGIFPPVSFTPAELQNIAFCAFPDSVQFDQGSQTHSFRVRDHSPDGFVYGFSHFVQKRDAASKRGYSQRSVVLLTQFQYPALYSSLSDIFGPLFALHGLPMLEAACHNIATWPDPTPGKTIELGFLGSVLHVELPHSPDVQQVTTTASFNEKYDPHSHILAATAPFSPPPILLFEASLSHLWSIWECLVLCEPILVFGASPAQTSQAIWWLRDLLRPIPLAGDIRPYFTMQDADYLELVNKRQPKAGLILGVTNPFFEKSCTHWPHVLSLGRRIPAAASPNMQRSPALGASAGPTPGWVTKTHKRHISKDRALLKQLEGALKRDNAARMEASLALRRHFCSRSAQLIAPLARYLNSLIPSPSEVHHARKASLLQNPSLKPATLSVPTISSSVSTSASLLAHSSKSGSISASSSSSALSLPSASAISAAAESTTSSNSSTPALRSQAIFTRTPRIPNTAPQTPQVPFSTHRSPQPGHNNRLRLKPFNNVNFFASLKKDGTVLPFKSTAKRTEFYERWLKSPAFGTWLAQQAHFMEGMLNDTVTATVGVNSPSLGRS